MRTILNPRWLLLVNTIPLAILFGMYVTIYQVIGTLLAPENQTAWWEIGCILGVLWVFNWAYTLFLSLKKQEIPIWYAIFVLFAYTIFFLQYAENERLLIPWNVPRWMLPNTMWEYVGTFMMPLLFHALMVVIVRLTSSYTTISVFKNLGFAVAVPFFWYISFMILMPILNGVEMHKIGQHIMIILSVSLATTFLFFLCRAIYVFSMMQMKGKEAQEEGIGVDNIRQSPRFESIFWESNKLVLKLLVGVLAPLLGLALNHSMDNIFGNFSHWSFYAIASANGIFLCLPSLQNPLYRLILFALRGVTFTYIFYFFLVFLPILPLSMVLLLAVVGALTLAPLVLFFLQIQQLWSDANYLYQYFNKLIIKVLLVSSLLVLPLFLHFSYLKDRQDLHQALDYVYAPNLSQEVPKIDVKRLKSVLFTVQRNKDNNNWGSRNRQSPFLSLYYNWLVLDNLTISTDKVERLSKIFVGKEDNYDYYESRIWNRGSWQGTPFPDSVKISKATVNSTFDKEKQFWTSWIDLEITNLDTTTTGFNNQSEYRTKFALPDGAWVSGYYLWIEKEKVHGLLAEKKTAMWVYNQIVSTRRDPGLLHYTSGNEISFRVFPFLPSETRKTGIQLIHKEPIHFQIDSLTLFLGDSANAPTLEKPIVSKNQKAIYIPKQMKKQLPKVKRETYPHFIVNCSKGKEDKQGAYKNLINQFIITHSLSKDKAKISLTNAYIKTVNLGENWENNMEKSEFEGGFFLERAIDQILFENRDSDKVPQIVVVTDSMSEVIIEKEFKDYKLFYPENQAFFLLSNFKDFTAYRLDNLEEMKMEYNALQAQGVLAWKNEAGKTYYLPDNEHGSIVWNEKASTTEDTELVMSKKDWSSGLELQGQWFQHTFHAENTDSEWLPLVKNSFQAQLMTPVTSFISLENEAQRQALLQKQEDVLNAKKSLDISEDEVRMSEPSLLVSIAGGFLVILIAGGFFTSSIASVLGIKYKKMFFPK